MNYLAEGLVQAFALLLGGDEETWSAIRTTISISTISILASLAIGVPIGFLVGYREFPGRKAIRTVSDTLLALPTVVVGLVVYAFLSRRGPLGDLGLLFTIPGVAAGQTVLALPIVVSMTASAVEGLDRRLRSTLLTLGARSAQLAAATLLEARYAILLAAASAYGRVISEVGVSMMIGGNIKWHTRTITTAIALETGKGEFAMGVALGIVLLLIAFFVNLSLAVLRRRARS